TIVASIPLLKLYPTRRQLWGVLGALVCLGTLMVDGLDRQIPPLDLLLAISVPLSYAITNTWIRRSLRHVPALDLSFYSLALAAIVQLPIAGGMSSDSTATTEQWWIAFGAVTFLGVAGTGLSTFLFNKLIHEQGPLFAGMVTNLVPIGALVWGLAGSRSGHPAASDRAGRSAGNGGRRAVQSRVGNGAAPTYRGFL
ncbi:MAG: DMT family transporter, partial [Planctomycetales bacterium]|nr:DMT family transporter [Planctomycetales bacterium]